MAGLTTHLIVSLIGFLIGLLIFRDWKYGLAFVIGHLAPDLISFGITGIIQGSLNPAVIMTNSWFHPLAMLGHTFFNWIILGGIIWIIALMFYSFKKLSKKNFIMIILLLVCLMIGVSFHLLFDIWIQEVSYWI